MRPQPINQLLSRNGLAIFIYGFSGTGKTACCRNLNPEKSIFVTCEPWGLRTLERFGWKQILASVPSTCAEFEQAVREAVTQGCENLVIDTVTRFYDLAEIFHEVKMHVPRETQGKVTFDRMGFCKVITERLLDTCLDAVQRGINVIFLCHEKTSIKSGTEVGLTGQLPEIFARNCDLVLHTRSVQESGKPPRYILECPGGDDYGKDLFGLGWPRDNDIAAVITECRRRMAVTPTPLLPIQDKPSVPATQNPEATVSASIHPPAPREASPTSPAPLSPPAPPSPTPTEKKEEKTESMVRIKGGLAGPEEPAPPPAPRAAAPFSELEVAYQELKAIAEKNGISEGALEQLLFLNAGKKVSPWPLRNIAAVRLMFEGGKRRTRAKKQQPESPGTLPAVDNEVPF